MMRIRILALAAAIPIALVMACGSDVPATAPPTAQPTSSSATATPTAVANATPQTINVAFSDKERADLADVPIQDIVQLVEGNTEFAFDLYRQLADSEDGNLILSPHSISIALAMAYAGARGNTEKEMADALKFGLDQERLHAAFNGLDQHLANRNPEVEPNQKFTLEITNSIWGQRDFEFKQPFLDTLAENYGSGMRLVDYRSDPESARLAINGWVEDNTNGRIMDLVPQGAVYDLTRLALVNAIFFKAAWASEFDPNLTSIEDFRLLDGSKVDVEMMRQEVELPFLDGDGFKAVMIPYAGSDSAMTVLVPDSGKFEEFEASLDAARMASIMDEMGRANVQLEFPKFTFGSKFSLPEALEQLGMRDAFKEGGIADFSGIHEPTPLHISDIFHQGFIAVDEQGTEAAAATAALISAEQGPPRTVELTVDRPFIFLIHSFGGTRTVLFTGRVLDPTAS